MRLTSPPDNVVHLKASETLMGLVNAPKLPQQFD
jgi:hypothetical protein